MEHERAMQNLAVESYLLGEMSPAERESFEEHYFECSICAEDLRAAAQFMEDAKDLLAGSDATAAIPARSGAREAQPLKQSGWDWLAWLKPQLAAAMIAALVLVVGVERFSTIPGLRRQVDEFETPKVIQPVVLRPVVRGDAGISRTGAGKPLIFVFDLPESPQLSPGTPLRFIVKSADNHSVLELAGEAPNPGERITLSVPRMNAAPGDYALVVEGPPASSGSPSELGQYPFKLEQ